MYVVIFRATIKQLDAHYGQLAARIPSTAKHSAWGNCTGISHILSRLLKSVASINMRSLHHGAISCKY